MTSNEALIKRIPKGGTCSVKGLARQLGYLSRQNDPERQTIFLVGAQRHQLDPGAANVMDPNDVWGFARRVYQRSGRLPPDDPNGELANDLTIHFVMSFPLGTDFDAAERAGRDWAETVFGYGYRNDQGFVERHDYVTAFHRHENDSAHPHMHVVVDRCPLGGGNLLTLHEGHPHWSYEAMRFNAVDAAASQGIELVATTRVDRALTERPMTDVQYRRLQRLLTGRPITLDEAQRRRADAATVPYFDPDFDETGMAPFDGHDDEGERDLRRGCTPVFIREANRQEPLPQNLDGDNFDPGDYGDDNTNNRRRTGSSESSNSDHADVGQTGIDVAAGPSAQPGQNNGQPLNEHNPSGKRPRTETEAGPSQKRPRTEPPSAGPSNANNPPGAIIGDQPSVAQTPRNSPSQDGAQAQPAPDPVQQRYEAVDHRRQAALEALRAHRREARNGEEGVRREWRDEDRRLRREARQALIEQRRAHAGNTNVTTRAQRSKSVV